MKDPRTIIIGTPFADYLTVLVYKSSGFTSIRNHKRIWDMNVATGAANIERENLNFHLPEKDEEVMKELHSRFGQFDILHVAVDSSIQNGGLYSCLGGQRLFAVPDAAFFVLPMDREFTLLYNSTPIQKRSFLLPLETGKLVVIQETPKPTVMMIPMGG